MPNFAELKVSFQDRAETIGILGENDEYLRVLNDSFACRILGRDTNLSINGEEGEVNAAMQVIEALLLLYRQGTKLTMHEV
ncbi:phosphate starvation-inducible protein PhoH, partial [Fusobacterium mortiferum]|nr:phosphate starvation-inducible protein PhoH [Fusobacterium mortiferum]